MLCTQGNESDAKKSLPGTYRGSSQTGMTDGDRSNWWLTSTEACVLVDADDKTAFSQGRNILTKIYCVCCGGGLFLRSRL